MATSINNLSVPLRDTVYSLRQQRESELVPAVVKLMESAERTQQPGPMKNQMVLAAFTDLKSDLPAFAGVDIATIQTIIEAIIYVSQTVVAVNKSTGCWTWFTGLFRRNKA